MFSNNQISAECHRMENSNKLFENTKICYLIDFHFENLLDHQIRICSFNSKIKTISVKFFLELTNLPDIDGTDLQKQKPISDF